MERTICPVTSYARRLRDRILGLSGEIMSAPKSPCEPDAIRQVQTDGVLMARAMGAAAQEGADVPELPQKVVTWYGMDTDIDDLKRVAERLRQDEKELRRIIDAIPQTIVVLGPDGRNLYANQAVLDYTGLTLDEVMAADFRARVYHPDDVERLHDERQEALARGVPFEIEQRALRKDGQYRWFLIQYNPFYDEQGHLVRWYATGTDIEDRKQAEERTRKENFALREEIAHSSMFEEIVGSSPELRTVLAQVAKVAPVDSTVLILGETGTGKELIARAIHRRSSRSTRAFIRVNCAAIPSSLIAAELFGREKGAFTGALQRRVGRFESADGGTIFLDDIGEIPMETQVALSLCESEGIRLLHCSPYIREWMLREQS